MKRINLNISIYLLFLLVASCTKYDDAAPPDGGIQGSVIDLITQKPIQTEQPNGIRVKLIDKKPQYSDNVTPIYFWVKPDGTFKNSKVFSGPYEITVVDGAFYPLATPQSVNVSGMTDVNFTVEPFLAITAVATPVAGGVSVQYKLVRKQEGAKISEARVLVASVPNVTTSVFDVIDGVKKMAVRDFSSVPDQTVLDNEYTDVINGLMPGRTYYVRVAARTATTISARYNYSPVFKVTIP